MIPDGWSLDAGSLGSTFVYTIALGAAAWLAARAVRAAGLTWARAALRRGRVDVPDDALRSFQRPLFFFFASIAGLWVLRDRVAPPALASATRVALNVVAGLSGVLLASRVLTVGGGVARIHARRTGHRFDDQLVPLVEQGGQVLVWVLGLLFVLQNSGVEVWSFLAGLGIGSVAIALAAQDSLANLFGALNIFLDRPFQVGDWIVLGEVEGDVEEVGFGAFGSERSTTRW